MQYQTEKKQIHLSVREICDLLHFQNRSDLRAGGASLERMEQGKTAHKALQASLLQGDFAEVSLSVTLSFHDRLYEIAGRADVVRQGTPTIVEEIKSILGKRFSEPDAYHTAQANLTAWLYLQKNRLSSVCVRRTLIRVEDGESKSFNSVFTAAELTEYCLNLLSKIEYRAAILEERYEMRLSSMKTVRFPYPNVRPAQEMMLSECYRDIKRGKRLFLQAPTGIGKTISALFPAVRAMGEGHCDRIFYLTAKTAAAREAYRACGDLFGAGANLRTVHLSAREHLCVNLEAKNDPAGISRHCNPEKCPRLRGFYEKCPDAVCNLLREQNGYPRKTILEAANRAGICPYEFQLELSEFCDILICDYNYVFDPMVYLRRYFEEDARLSGNFVFLIDEAHNLANRASEMYSVVLSLQKGEELLRILTETHPAEPEKEWKYLREYLDTLRKFKSLCRDTLCKNEEGEEQGYSLYHGALPGLSKAATDCRTWADDWLRKHPEDEAEAPLVQFLAPLRRMEAIQPYFDERFLSYIMVQGGDTSVRLICLDPSEILSEKLALSRSAVLFSATLTPLDYFADILGGGKKAIRIALPSPYPAENLCLAAVTGLSVRFEDREKSVRKLVGVIAATASAKQGNYIVYFPSYDYMEKVHEAFVKKYPQVTTVLQTRGMSAEEKETFLNAFADDGKLRVGFCVLGGSFSEGVDLPGGRLIGAVVVGVGLPGLSDERNILRDYYESTRESGYDYAYTYPGMNRVLQAAGRVIRSETDRGVIVLADDRWAEPRYRALMPEHWSGIVYANDAHEIADLAAGFWKKEE